MTEPAVAVVGLGCRFPGAGDVTEYWDNLRAGRCAIVDFSRAELVDAEVAADQLDNPRYVPAKGYLADADRFEADLFGYTAAEAAVLDPQHRLLLETAWAALEDAGYDPRRAPERTGVYAGGGLSEHMLAAHADPALAAALGGLQVRILTDRDFLSTAISYRLGLSGPSMTVQTACSTSLTAIHLATQALLVGECDVALAGGVSIDTVHKRGYLYQEGGILSPDGRCRPFDEKAAGTVPGNGAGMVVLRRLADALADGDPVRAVILGTAVTNDGSAKLGFTAPGVDQQTAAIVEAWSAAGLAPSAAQYLETHGTATELGDRVEAAAMRAAFGDKGHCGIGSVKSNLGHLDAAAGVAAFVKTVLMLEHRTLVPTVNVSRPHPDLRLAGSPFWLVDRLAGWPEPDAGGPRLAGVTSLGIGGTNVHTVLSEAPAGAGRRVHRPGRRFAGQRFGALRPVVHPTTRDSGPAGRSAATPDGEPEPVRPMPDRADPSGAVAALLREALGLPETDPLDRTYLAAGGDSLMAVHLVGRLRDDLDLDVPIELFLEPRSLRELVSDILAVRETGDALSALLDQIESEGVADHDERGVGHPETGSRRS